MCRRRWRWDKRHGFRTRIDVDDANTDAELDLVAAIPFLGVDDDLVSLFLAGEDRGEHHAVVVDVRLVTEDGDAELRVVLEDLLDAGHARHAVADDHQSPHRAAPSRGAFSTRAADCL